MKKILLAGAALTVLAAPAFAADLPAPMPAPIAAPLPVDDWDWTGFYIGAHGGYAWGEADTEVTLERATFGTATIYDDSDDLDGFFGGGQIGINKQYGNFLIGLEADGSWSGIDGDGTSSVTVPTGVLGPAEADFDTSVDTEIEWLATARVRAGVVWNRALLYATGGAAVAGVDSEFNVENTGGPAALDGYEFSFGDDERLLGWTIGGGVEVAVTKYLTVKAEYLYMDFEEFEVSAADTTAPGGDAFLYEAEQDIDLHTIKLGVNWRW